MAKLDVQYLIDVPRSARNGGASIISIGGGSSALPDFTLYVKRDGSTPMLGNFDVGGFSVTNVSLIDGIDLPAHVANPNAHHNQTHEIIGSDHTVSASPLQLVGAVSLNTLGLLTPSSNPGQAAAILRTDALGNITIQILGLVKGDFHSPSSYRFLNEAGTGYRNITADGLTGNYVNNTNGYWYTPAEWHTFRDSTTGNFKPVAMSKLLVSNDSGHFGRVPDNGIYSLGAIRGDVKLSTPLIDTISGHLTLQPTVDLLLQPGSNLVKLQSGVALQSHNYASQLTGMRVTAAGEGDFRYLFTDEMHAKSFIADLEQALAGGQIISKSVAVLSLPFPAPAPGDGTWLYVEDLPSAPNMAVFQSGDVVALRQFSRAGGGLSISWCWGTVASYVDGDDQNGVAEGEQAWYFTRSTAPNAGAMATGAIIQPGALVLDFGTSGNGYYEVNAIDGLYGANSPYWRIVRWTGHPATGQAVRVQGGQLRGLFAQDEFGLFAGTGTANTDRWLRLSDFATGNGINNLPFRLRNNGVTTVELNAWNDAWMGPSSADKRFNWDGSQLTITGQIFVTGGNAATLSNVGGAENMVRNSSFEMDSNYDGIADGFSPYSNDSVPTLGSLITGFNSPKGQRIAWSGTNTSSKGIILNTGTRIANQPYIISFWARTNVATSIGLHWNIQPTTLEALTPTTSDGEWRRYAWRATWGADNADSWYISVAYGQPIVSGWIDFDNIMIYVGTDVVPYSAAPTDAIGYGGLLNMPMQTGGAGLYATNTHLGYWNGSAWKMWMNNAGQFFFGGDTGARLQWNGAILAGYNSANAVQWAASAVTGQLTAGGGAVVLDVNGETIYRPTIVITAEIPEPGFGTMPNMSPTAAQALEFRDTAATFYRPGAPYSYDYPGNTLLRIYSSSKHHVPDNLTPAWWTHRIDAVIEVPAITEAGDSAIYTRWLWLKAPTVVVDGVLKVNSNAEFTGNVVVQALGLGASKLQSYNGLVLRNWSDTAYQGIVVQFLTSISGNSYSDAVFTFANAGGTAYQDVTLKNLGLYGGNIYSDNAIQLLDWAANSAQNLRARSLLASYDYSHSSRVPDYGIYSLGGVAIGTPGAITSGYILDVNGAARFRSSIAVNAHINLSPIEEPSTSAATGILWMGTDNKLYFKKPNGTKIVVVN